jgi:hypothetical protein
LGPDRPPFSVEKQRDPRVSTLERLAKAVEMKPGQLLDGLPPA